MNYSRKILSLISIILFSTISCNSKRISGSGDARGWTTAKPDVTMSGSGKLSYDGSPVVSSSISGSGRVKSLGSK